MYYKSNQVKTRTNLCVLRTGYPIMLSPQKLEWAPAIHPLCRHQHDDMAWGSSSSSISGLGCSKEENDLVVPPWLEEDEDLMKVSSSISSEPVGGEAHRG